jgi:hypothetical protein
MTEIISFRVDDFIYPGEYSDGMYMYMLVASRISGRICSMGLTYEEDFSFHASGLRSDGERLFEYRFTKAEDAMLVRLQGIEN